MSILATSVQLLGLHLKKGDCGCEGKGVEHRREGREWNAEWEGLPVLEPSYLPAAE
jgi:hypothetical protein